MDPGLAPVRAALHLTVQLALDPPPPAPLAPPSRQRLRAWAARALLGPVDATLRIVDAEEGRRLNAHYRRHDHATNVLTFPYGDDGSGTLHGDIALCWPVVCREAAEQGKPLAAHCAHLLVHGMLHLQGLDHLRAREARRMEALETRILAELGYPDPYAPV